MNSPVCELEVNTFDQETWKMGGISYLLHMRSHLLSMHVMPPF